MQETGKLPHVGRENEMPYGTDTQDLERAKDRKEGTWEDI